MKLTNWRPEKEVLVRTSKVGDRKKGAHFLETGKGGICQACKEATMQGALTPWRLQRQGFVRTQEESNQARGTHFLETMDGGTCQDTERKRLSEGHLLSGDQGTYQNMGRKWLSEGTHFLETTEGGTCQDTERNQLGECYS